MSTTTVPEKVVHVKVRSSSSWTTASQTQCSRLSCNKPCAFLTTRSHSPPPPASAQAVHSSPSGRPGRARFHLQTEAGPGCWLRRSCPASGAAAAGRQSHPRPHPQAERPSSPSPRAPPSDQGPPRCTTRPTAATISTPARGSRGSRARTCGGRWPGTPQNPGCSPRRPGFPSTRQCRGLVSQCTRCHQRWRT